MPFPRNPTPVKLVRAHFFTVGFLGELRVDRLLKVEVGGRENLASRVKTCFRPLADKRGPTWDNSC